MGDSTNDKVTGSVEHAKGTAKEAAGKLTDNERLEREGRADQVKGDTRKAVGHVKDAGEKVKESVDDAMDRA